MNVAVITGRLTKDPEVRYNGDMGIGRFTVAVDRIQKGEKTADFINVVCFGKTAENVEKFCTKGMMVCVNGSIRTGSYTNQEGRTVYTTEISANNVEFLSKSDKNSEPKEEPKQEQAFVSMSEEDCPF